MSVALLVIEALLAIAIAVQVWYVLGLLRSGVEVGATTKIVVGVNVALLTGLMVVLGIAVLRMRVGG